MKNKSIVSLAVVFTAVSAFLFLGASRAYAHCDGMDGPVVTAAREALETGEVNRVLVWVQKEQEGEIHEAFEQALAVRQGGPEARELADRYFFETLVRVHRAGEGAAYTGLKPAGRDLGAAIPAADEALESGELEPLEELVIDAVREGLHEHFARSVEKKSYDADDVPAGREFVESYVEYVHWVERLVEAAEAASHGHEQQTVHPE